MKFSCFPEIEQKERFEPTGKIISAPCANTDFGFVESDFAQMETPRGDATARNSFENDISQIGADTEHISFVEKSFFIAEMVYKIIVNDLNVKIEI